MKVNTSRCLAIVLALALSLSLCCCSTEGGQPEAPSEETAPAEERKDKTEDFVEAFIADGKYREALDVIADSEDEVDEKLVTEARRGLFRESQIGDSVPFGHYEDRTVILWTVLDKDDEAVLLLPEHNLAKSVFNTEPSYDGDWTTSDLREHMNGEGAERTFSDSERGDILTRTHVYDGDFDIRSKSYAEGSEKTCEDKVFFLSCGDVQRYLPEPQDRIASFYGGKEGAWWLSDVAHRNEDEGGFKKFRSIGWEDGEIGYFGEMAELGVRPVVWVSYV